MCVHTHTHTHTHTQSLLKSYESLKCPLQALPFTIRYLFRIGDPRLDNLVRCNSLSESHHGLKVCLQQKYGVPLHRHDHFTESNLHS